MPWDDEPDQALLGRLVDTHAHPTDRKPFDNEYRDAAGRLHLKKVSGETVFTQLD